LQRLMPRGPSSILLFLTIQQRLSGIRPWCRFACERRAIDSRHGLWPCRPRHPHGLFLRLCLLLGPHPHATDRLRAHSTAAYGQLATLFRQGFLTCTENTFAAFDRNSLSPLTNWRRSARQKHLLAVAGWFLNFQSGKAISADQISPDIVFAR